VRRPRKVREAATPRASRIESALWDLSRLLDVCGSETSRTPWSRSRDSRVGYSPWPGTGLWSADGSVSDGAPTSPVSWEGASLDAPSSR